VGRKYTFIVTLTGNGLGTAAIGLIPTYASIGVAAAFILFGLRIIQGLCLGGEYGGAITYVASTFRMSAGLLHRLAADVPDAGHRVSLAVIVGTRLTWATTLSTHGAGDSVPHLFPAGDHGVYIRCNWGKLRFSRR